MDATSSSNNGAQGQNPFFRSLNQTYGEPWQSSNGVNPLHLKETPDYKDLVRILFSKKNDIFREREKLRWKTHWRLISMRCSRKWERMVSSMSPFTTRSKPQWRPLRRRVSVLDSSLPLLTKSNTPNTVSMLAASSIVPQICHTAQLSQASRICRPNITPAQSVSPTSS